MSFEKNERQLRTWNGDKDGAGTGELRSRARRLISLDSSSSSVSRSGLRGRAAFACNSTSSDRERREHHLRSRREQVRVDSSRFCGQIVAANLGNLKPTRCSRSAYLRCIRPAEGRDSSPICCRPPCRR